MMYSVRRLLSSMARVEERTRRPFHEAYPDLHEQIWQAIDTDNVQKVIYFVKKIEEKEKDHGSI